MAFEEVALKILEAYNSTLSAVPESFQNFINLFLIVIIIVVYSVFIWKLHKFVGTKNILNLNLNQYNKVEHPTTAKIVAGLFYFLEYIIILPFLIFFWFSLFSIFLILVIDLELQTILFISAAVIAAIRMTSYIPNYGETLAKEIAKLLPLNLLAIALLTPGFFNIGRVFSHFGRLDDLFSIILIYLFLIVILEIILRFFEFVFSIFGLEEEK